MTPPPSPKTDKSPKKARLNLKQVREKCPSSKARTNLWTKAKSQKIVTQGYSALYNTPFSFKSSAWDLSPVAIEFGMCSERGVFLPPRRIETHGTEVPIRVRLTPNRRYSSLLSSTDSDLEAFSHNPTDGSFAPLPFQASANANCLNLRFLSYWSELLLQQPYSAVG